MEYLLAHDLGTSGNKATLFAADGTMADSVTYSYPVSYTNGTWAEQDPDDWWKAVVETTRRLTEKIDKREIAGVSFSGQMMGCVCVDETGRPLRKAIIWADMRAVEEQRRIEAQMDKGRFYRITGHRLSPSYGGQKFMWVKEHEPDIYRRTYRMLNAKDYIIFKLTGNFVTEYTDASSTCLLNLDRLEWSEELLEVMGIGREKLPELHRSTDIAGTVTEEAAALVGLLPGTPVVCGGGDGVCSAIGTGCIDEGVAHSSMGTSSWISITSKKAIYDEEQRTFNWAHIVPGYVLPTGTMQSGGGAYAWYVDHFCGHEAELAGTRGVSVYTVLEEELKSSPPGSNGLLFLPYLMGERSPRWNPDARAAFTGIGMEHRRGDFLRAIQEGVAMNLNIILDIFRDHGQEIREMVVAGGGAKSRVWQQILADVYRMRLQIPTRLDEATSMGAAITAGVGVGLFRDFHEADRFLELHHSVEPDEAASGQYQRLKPAFEAAYQGMLPVYEALKEFING